MKRAVLGGCRTDDATSRDYTQWTALGPLALSNALPFCETHLGSPVCHDAYQPQHRGPITKLDLEINEAEQILEQRRSKNAKLRECKANIDEAVSVRRRELALIIDRLRQCSGDSGSTTTTHAGISKLDEQFVTPSASEVHKVVSRLVRLFQRQALLEVRYRAKKLRSEELASFFKSASVDQEYSTDAFAKVRPPLAREHARCCQEEVRRNALAKRARKRHLHVSHHSHLKEERKNIGKDVETELLRLKRQSAEKKRAKKLDILRKQRKAQLDAEFECLRVEDQQQKKEKPESAAGQPECDLDCIDSLLRESAQAHVDLTQPSARVQTTLQVSLSGSPECHEKEAARLVDWLKTVTSVVGIPALSAFESTEFTNRPIKISEDGIISIEFEVDPNSIGSVERAFKYVCPQSSENITLTVGSCVHSETTQSLTKEEQCEEGSVHMFGILLDDETSIADGLNRLVRDDTPLGRVHWSNEVDILQKPRNMIILRAHLADDFSPDDVLHELDKFTIFACRVTDAVTTDARRMFLNTIARGDHTELSFLHEENSIVHDRQDTTSLQENPSDLESDISPDCQEEDHQDILEKPVKDATEVMEDKGGDRKQIVFTVETNAGHDILDVHPTLKPQLLSKDNKSKEESARSLVSSDPSADTRIVRFNVKFTPGQDPCKVAACAFSLECVKKSCEWDLADVTYAPNPSFPAVLITAILFEGVDKEVVYDALCRELIENPKNLMVTFVDYLYDWDQPTDAIKLLTPDIENAIREASLLQEKHLETSRGSADCVRDLESAANVANIPATFQSLTTPSLSSSFGSLQKELAFIGLSEYYATLRDLGVSDLTTLARMSKNEIKAVAQKASMTDDHQVRLATLAEESVGGVVDKARRQTSFMGPNTIERKVESLVRKRFEDAREATSNLPLEIEDSIEHKLTVKKEIEVNEDSDSDNDTCVDSRGNLNSFAREVSSSDGEALSFSKTALLKQKAGPEKNASRISGDVVDEPVEDSQENTNISGLDFADRKECQQDNCTLVQERHDGSSKNDTYDDYHVGYEAKKTDDNVLHSCASSRSKEATDSTISGQVSVEPSSSDELVADVAAARTTSESSEHASRIAEDRSPYPSSGKQDIEEEDASRVQQPLSKSDDSPTFFDSIESGKIETGVEQKTAQDSRDTSSRAPAASACLVSLQAELTPLASARKNLESSAPDDDALEVGSRVDVNYRGLGHLYSGTITQLNSDGTYTVNYDDGEIGSSIPKASIYSSELTPKSTMNFAIGMRVEVNYRAMDVYYPGAIAGIHPNGTFDIHYDDGDREEGVDPIMLRPLGDNDRPHDYMSDPSMDSIEEIRNGFTIDSSHNDGPAPSLESSLRQCEKRANREHVPSTEDSTDFPISSANGLVAVTRASSELERDTLYKSDPAMTSNYDDLRQSETHSIAASIARDSITQADEPETEPDIEVGTQVVHVDTDNLLGVELHRGEDHVEIEGNMWSENPTGVMADVADYRKSSESNDDNENLDSEHVTIENEDSKASTFTVAQSPLTQINEAETLHTRASLHDRKDETVDRKHILNAGAPSASFDDHIVEASTKRDVQFSSEGVPTASISYNYEQFKISSAENGLNIDTNRELSVSPSGRLEEPATTPVTSRNTSQRRSLGNTPNIAETTPISSETASDFERTNVTSGKNAQREPAQRLNTNFKEPAYAKTEGNFFESKAIRDSILAVGSNDVFGNDTVKNTDSVDSGSPLASSSQAGTEKSEDQINATGFSQGSEGSLGTEPGRKDLSMSLHRGNNEQSHASSTGTLGFSTNFSVDDEPVSPANEMPHSDGNSVHSGASDHSQDGESCASGDA